MNIKMFLHCCLTKLLLLVHKKKKRFNKHFVFFKLTIVSVITIDALKFG